FVTGRGTPLVYNNWRRSFWRPTLDMAGIDDVVPQDLRRTCVTRLFTVDNWSPAAVQAFVGHSDARVTLEVYASVNSRDLPVPSTLKRPESGGGAI
ncbi:MAG: tyrosine-type recombinase/integrase, partial [Actinomycetota bacterium]|nr:tyrosine-type recombinase/integrase [Actinomycetota bacterium]